MADLAKIADELSKLTVLEAAELSKMLEEKWGVSAAAPRQREPVVQPEPPARRARPTLRQPARSTLRGGPGLLLW
jgi:ribosomal protein L7/L12